MGDKSVTTLMQGSFLLGDGMRQKEHAVRFQIQLLLHIRTQCLHGKGVFAFGNGEHGQA